MATGSNLKCFRKSWNSRTRRKSFIPPNRSKKGVEQLVALIETAMNRIRILKIAGTSPYGWSTVSEYEANPIATGDEDNLFLNLPIIGSSISGQSCLFIISEFLFHYTIHQPMSIVPLT